MPSAFDEILAAAEAEAAEQERIAKQASLQQHQQTSNHVYVPSPEHAWIPARIIDDGATLSIPIYKDEQSIVCDGGRTARKFTTRPAENFSSLPLQNVDENAKLKVVADMVDLPFLHEAAILYNLKARHVDSIPYTRTGDIVLAVNPYKWFHDMYSTERQDRYAQIMVWDRLSTATPSPSLAPSAPPSPASSASDRPGNEGGDPRLLLEPHVYESASLAYRGLAADGEDQSILVSGESGAGKTETVKICMNAIASVQRGPKRGNKVRRAGRNSTTATTDAIVQRVLDSNPLLEAFGNAQTLRNDNSSRFGKYIQLQFDKLQAPVLPLAGSKCEVYLLEKSRVISHEPHERTYHIFYQLLAAPEDVKVSIWDGLEDTDSESFDYVGWSETDTIEGMTDRQRFQLTVDSLKLIGVYGEKLRMLMRTICIVLQLGNIEFEPIDDDSCRIVGYNDPDGEFLALASLMGIAPGTLAKSLTLRTVEARSEKIQVPLSAERAKESTDAFAKEIYAKTFLWLVRTINDATCAELNYTPPGNGRRVSDSNFGTIGLLDIFGFEWFEVNRFEQLCINYANEKLQQKFTQDIFQSVQAEYEYEGIELEEITYDDNTDVLDLVEGRMGLLAFLNEECTRPKGSDKTFVYKAMTMNKENPCLFRDMHAPDTEFGIRHYAGDVTYSAENFVSKNTDTLPSDLKDCATLSSNDIIANELGNEAMMNSKRNASDDGKKKRRPKASGSVGGGGKSTNTKRGQSNIVGETVWTKFKNQLTSLMSQLSETRTRYIRCIKPNKHKMPLLMEHMSTVEQLRCAGVVAAVTISRSAFPNRLDHEVVLERFKSLWPKGERHFECMAGRKDSGDDDDDPENATRRMVTLLLTLSLKEMEIDPGNGEPPTKAFVIGRSRAYFRAGALEFLEAERLKYLATWVTEIQSSYRRHYHRTRYLRARAMAICMQSYLRRRIATRSYQMLKAASIQVQCWLRCIYAARLIVVLRSNYNATLIQSRWRILVARRRLRTCLAASIVIQAMVRGTLQRPKYRQALIDKAEEAKLENQLRSLQKKLEEAELRRHDAERQAEEREAEAIRRFQAKEAAAKEAAAEQERLQREEETREEQERLKREQEQQDIEAQRRLSSEQQTLMDESGKMLEYLRKEVFKLRGQNEELRANTELLKENNQRLMDAHASVGASFTALNQHAKQLAKQKGNLEADLAASKAQVQKLNVLQVELKEEIKMKQATYIAEVHSRLQYQKALTKITDIMQERCRDHRLVEQVLEIADECEMEYMAGVAGGAGTEDNATPASAAAAAAKSGGGSSFWSFFSS